MSTFYDLYDFSLFAEADRNRIDRLLQQSANRITAYHEGDLIALQGDPCRSLMLLCSGSVSARMTHDEGKEIVIETLHAPEILAPAFLYGSENHFPVSLFAATDCRVWFISREVFLEMMEADRTVLRRFLENISDRSVFLSRKLNEFALQSLPTRILSYLKTHGHIQNIQEVAFIMGVARPSLSRALSLLVEQGRVRKESGGYVAADHEG